MRKLISLLVLVAACHSHSTPPATRPSPAGGSMTGAATPRGAVDAFLAAARSEDLQAMSVVWGTERGPARDVLPQDQLEKRELIMMCYFRHQSARILSEAPTNTGNQTVAVELRRGDLTGSTTFNVVAGPERRWYVESADIEPLRRFCSKR